MPWLLGLLWRKDIVSLVTNTVSDYTADVRSPFTQLIRSKSKFGVTTCWNRTDAFIAC